LQAESTFCKWNSSFAVVVKTDTSNNVLTSWWKFFGYLIRASTLGGVNVAVVSQASPPVGKIGKEGLVLVVVDGHIAPFPGSHPEMRAWDNGLTTQAGNVCADLQLLIIASRDDK